MMTADKPEIANQPRTVWVLGNGQLGAMLRLAGEPLNILVKPIGVDAAERPVLAEQDLVTAEQELWPETPATTALSAHPNFINGAVFPRLADRLTQKQLIDELGFATAPWRHVTADSDSGALFATLGDCVLLKQRRGGYDGKGQYWLRREGSKNNNTSHKVDGVQLPEAWREVSIAESAINFDEEISLVAVRNAAGDFQAYPLALNKHVDGILTATVANLPRLQAYQAQAERMLNRIMTALDYRGVMAMECFRVGDKLMINELAPRVHNSGHWTQAGTAICQFEAHLRGIAGLALPELMADRVNVMINLLGTPWEDRWLSIPGAEVHWYHKSIRPGRKVGHINVTLISALDCQATWRQLAAMLPSHYGSVITWIEQALRQASSE